YLFYAVFFFQAEDGIRDRNVTGVQTCALPISLVLSREVAMKQPTDCTQVLRHKKKTLYPLFEIDHRTYIDVVIFVNGHIKFIMYKCRIYDTEHARHRN